MKPRTLRLAAVGLAGLLLLAWAPAARALSPEAFLAVAYSQYGTAPDPRGSKEEQVLSEGLLGLHRRAETLRGQRLRRTPDLDPVEPISLCRCQDWDEAAYRIVKVETRPGPTDLTARLRVRLAPSGPPLTVFCASPRWATAGASPTWPTPAPTASPANGCPTGSGPPSPRMRRP